ncbi:hypothetical protein L3Q82_013576 [Scortum barcoo]|uniref:Uncharacterized protein n=1 Tax=Scortum barcoo TaxID=214431 RepID=A0ACB8W0Z2_9TELE|nr:hypothetical protein L3Q82_013576 [Scortum barcoo]
MKPFCDAVALAVVLTFICLQESSAVPVAEMQEPEEALSYDSPAAEHEETSVETWLVCSVMTLMLQDVVNE